MKLVTTITDFKKYTNTWAEAVRQFEGTGFRYLDFDFYSVIYPNSPFLGDNWMQAVQEAADAAAELGFSFVQAHSPNYNPLDPAFDHETGMLATLRSIEACAYLGIPNIVVHSGFSQDYRYPSDRKAFFEANRKYHEALFPAMEKYNVNVLIENSGQENMQGKYYFMTGQEMRDFLDECDHPLLHACWDTGHANMEGIDQYKQICDLGDHLKAVHFQDNFGTYDEHFAPFMGTLDMDAIMQGLLAIDYKGYLTFESQNMLTLEGAWPHPRQECPSITQRRLQRPSTQLRRKAEELLYEIGKYILSAYDCFEG